MCSSSTQADEPESFLRSASPVVCRYKAATARMAASAMANQNMFRLSVWFLAMLLAGFFSASRAEVSVHNGEILRDIFIDPAPERDRVKTRKRKESEGDDCGRCGEISGPPPEHEWDIRCCLQQQDLAHPYYFIVELHGTAHPVGHLSVVTPSGAKIGFDPAAQAFYWPDPFGEGFYALGPRPQPRIDAPTWNHDRYIVLRRQEEQIRVHYALVRGTYTVRVIGIAPGTYTLRFYPFGLAAGAAAEFRAVRIEKGEQHEYVFEGQAVPPIINKPPVKAVPLAVKRVQ